MTDMVQLLPAATDPPQLLVTLKSAASVPVAPILVTLSGALPGLVKVTVLAVLVPPTFVLGNVRDVVERVALGTTSPVPLRVAV